PPTRHLGRALDRMDADIGAAIEQRDAVAEILTAVVQQSEQQVDLLRVKSRPFEDFAANTEQPVAVAVVVEAIDDQRAVARCRQHEAEFPPDASHRDPWCTERSAAN